MEQLFTIAICSIAVAFSLLSIRALFRNRPKDDIAVEDPNEFIISINKWGPVHERRSK